MHVCVQEISSISNYVYASGKNSCYKWRIYRNTLLANENRHSGSVFVQTNLGDFNFSQASFRHHDAHTVRDVRITGKKNYDNIT